METSENQEITVHLPLLATEAGCNLGVLSVTDRMGTKGSARIKTFIKGNQRVEVFSGLLNFWIRYCLSSVEMHVNMSNIFK